MSREFEKQYDEEAHRFGVVGPRFRKEGRLNAYDFFLIVRWKANRAISKVARRLISIAGSDLEKGVSQLTSEVFRARNARERFIVLVQRWHLRLPTASAVLTVLYPEDFTVYDVRACNELKRFHEVLVIHGPCGGVCGERLVPIRLGPAHAVPGLSWSRSRG